MIIRSEKKLKNFLLFGLFSGYDLIYEKHKPINLSVSFYGNQSHFQTFTCRVDLSQYVELSVDQVVELVQKAANQPATDAVATATVSSATVAMEITPANSSNEAEESAECKGEEEPQGEVA